jgi:hypothetical protein
VSFVQALALDDDRSSWLGARDDRFAMAMRKSAELPPRRLVLVELRASRQFACGARPSGARELVGEGGLRGLRP